MRAPTQFKMFDGKKRRQRRGLKDYEVRLTDGRGRTVREVTYSPPLANKAEC